MKGLDVGPKTLEKFSEIISKSKMIFWNGPMGVFEIDRFSLGSIGLAGQIVRATEEGGAISIVGGGDSVAAVAKTGLKDKITHISTGGGASLEFMEGKVLPGVAVLQDR